MDHPRKIYQQQAVNWFAGVRFDNETGQWKQALNYDQFKSQLEIPKRKEISVMCSAKADTQGHRERIEFVNRLNKEFSGKVDVYGFGNRPMADKWDAIAPYRYHIVIENSIYPDYWTEKLADTYLGRSYPFYCGCPNIGEYFPAGAYTTIDITDFERSVKVIRKTIEEGRYESSIESIQEARELVLDKYNLFAELSRWCLDQDTKGQAAKVTLLPEARITRPFYWPMRNVEKYVRQNTWGKWFGKGKRRSRV